MIFDYPLHRDQSDHFFHRFHSFFLSFRFLRIYRFSFHRYLIADDIFKKDFRFALKCIEEYLILSIVSIFSFRRFLRIYRFFLIDIRTSGGRFQRRISIRVKTYSTEYPFSPSRSIRPLFFHRSSFSSISKDLRIFFFSSIFARAEDVFKRRPASSRERKKRSWIGVKAEA